MHDLVVIISFLACCSRDRLLPDTVQNLCTYMSAGEQDNSGGLLLSDDEDDENYVELEKSNVLLIGPTGSGRISRSLSLSFSMHMHIIMFIF